MVPNEINGIRKPAPEAGEWNIRSGQQTGYLLGCWVAKHVALWYLMYYRSRYPKGNFWITPRKGSLPWRAERSSVLSRESTRPQ